MDVFVWWFTHSWSVSSVSLALDSWRLSSSAVTYTLLAQRLDGPYRHGGSPATLSSKVCSSHYSNRLFINRLDLAFHRLLVAPSRKHLLFYPDLCSGYLARLPIVLHPNLKT